MSKKFIVLEEIEMHYSANLFNTIASTNDFVQAGELARAKKIAKELELATLENVDKNEQPRNYIVVERCDISTLKE
jgi:hypothetical protein|tara:strand:+ start:178 stop:405 length:228 start_codon:yes stop_codon:yes gene_type:complete